MSPVKRFGRPIHFSAWFRGAVLASTVAMAGAAFGQSEQVGATLGALNATIDRTKVRLVQNLRAQVPLDATFRDRNGVTETFGQLVDGKPTIILPIFFLCKGVCGLELQGTIAALKQMKKHQLGRDFNIVVLSIHPKETPDLAEGKFKSTIDEVGMPSTDRGWKFVVGDWANIHKVTDAIGFKYTYDPDKSAATSIVHPSGIVFVTPKGVVSSYIYGATYTPQEFDQNLNFAGRDEVGPPAQEIFFGCIHVDPLTGARSYQVENILKVLGLLTVSLLGLSIAVLSGKASLKRRRAS